MSKAKDKKSNAAPEGTTVVWGIKFWLPKHRTKSRWTEGHRVYIRNVTLRIKTEGVVQWQKHGISTRSAHLQPVLNNLDPDRLHELELEIPPGDLCHSQLVAGAHSGRTKFNELPPMGEYDVWDAQFRRGSINFLVERIATPARNGLDARIIEVKEQPYDHNDRPPVLRGVLHSDTKLNINNLELDWRPDWLRRARGAKEKGAPLEINIIPRPSYSYVTGVPTHIVLHQTGGSKITSPPAEIGSAIAQLTTGWDKNGKPHWRGVHYIIDYDGHVVKLAPDDIATGHAGSSEWRGGKTSLNKLAIGIEHVHHTEKTFPPEQIAASLNLVERLMNHFGIDPRHVVGHGEVRIIRASKQEELDSIKKYTKKHYQLAYDPKWGPALHPHDRLTTCPGGGFEWHQYAARGLIPDVFNAPAPSNWKSTAFGKYFGEDSNGNNEDNEDNEDSEDSEDNEDNEDSEDNEPPSLQRGDSAVNAKNLILGRKKIDDSQDQEIEWLTLGQEMIRMLHEKLRLIGYSIPRGGYNNDDLTFQWPLHLAVMAFQLKFLMPNQRPETLGSVDRVTAETILKAAELYA